MNATLLRFAGRAAAALAVSLVAAGEAAGQTLQLTDSSATVRRGGAYANTNLSSDLVLATRASGDATYVRRIALKFDTHNTIPAGTAIASAVLTLTVAGGNAEPRSIGAYRIAASYQEGEATWNRRSASATWAAGGGDLAELVASATVTDAPGSRVVFDVTALVQRAVDGAFVTSRYTRIGLVDGGASSRDSYKESFSDEAVDVSVRPVLAVTYAQPAPQVPPVTAPVTAPVVPPATEPAPVLQYIDRGVRQDLLRLLGGRREGAHGGVVQRPDAVGRHQEGAHRLHLLFEAVDRPDGGRLAGVRHPRRQRGDAVRSPPGGDDVPGQVGVRQTPLR